MIRTDVKEFEVKYMVKVITVGGLKALFTEFEITDDFEVWLSSDEEGNEILPMPANPERSLAIEKEGKKITLFPSHR